MINVRAEWEIDRIRASCRILADSFSVVSDWIRPGVELIKIDQVFEEFIRSRGATPAFKGYRGFPASACISVNDEVVHGIPSKRRLEDGDIVGIDVGCILDGYYSDSAVTYAVGNISKKKQRLMDVTRIALDIGIAQATVGNKVGDISHAVQSYVEENGYSVVRDLVGHGIGTQLHEDPQVPNFGKPNRGPVLRAGMVIAIEPMVNCKDFDVYTDEDQWTIKTLDGEPSAHFEHTIAITEQGPDVLTTRKNNG